MMPKSLAAYVAFASSPQRTEGGEHMGSSRQTFACRLRHFAVALAIASSGVMAAGIGGAASPSPSAVLSSANTQCPSVPSKLTSPGVLCGSELAPSGVGVASTAVLPLGAVPCPSAPGKPAGSPSASCAPGPAFQNVDSPAVTLPQGLKQCPSVAGKASTPGASCSSEPTVQPAPAVGEVSLPAGSSPCPSVGSKVSSASAACTSDQLPLTASTDRTTATLPAGTTGCPSTVAKKSSPNATCNTSSTQTSSLGAASGAPIQANIAGYSISLHESANYAVPGKSITLTATASPDVGPTPYYIEFYDTGTGALLGYCGSGTSCGVSVPESAAGTHYFIAYIGSYSTTNPPGTIAATSAIISCTWLSVGLSASPQYLAPGARTVLTATANMDVGQTPWYIEIFDRSTATWLASCGTGKTCSASALQSVATVHSYVAWVSGYGTGYPPPSIQVTSAFLGVVWFGITLTASPTALLPGGTTTLTATANADVGPSPYYVSIFDQTTGARVTSCPTGTVCKVAVPQSASTIRVYVAYVSGYGTTNPPPTVQATSRSVQVTWLSIRLDACNSSNLSCANTGGSPFFLAPGVGATLTATASQDVGTTPFYIQLFDQTSRTFLSQCGSGISCNTVVSQPVATTHAFAAYITNCCATTYPPASPPATSKSVAVTWLSVALRDCNGTVSICPTGSHTNGAVAGNAITLTASANADITLSPYELLIFDETTLQFIYGCPGPSSCTMSVTEPAAGSHTFVAYIADPDNTWPAHGIQATSTLAVPWVANCASSNNCTPTTFADNIFVYGSINAPVTAANEYAMRVWESTEGGGAGCPGQPANTSPWSYSGGPAGNPINTTQPEPGSTDWNSVHVQVFQDYSGQTCWHWGIKANGDTLLNGYYANILSALRAPSSNAYTQCVKLGTAVGTTPWGTGDFSGNC